MIIQICNNLLALVDRSKKVSKNKEGSSFFGIVNGLEVVLH